MRRDIVPAEVLPDLVVRPLGERVELDDRLVVVVDLDLADVRAGGPLVAAQRGHPGVEPLERAVEGLHLADAAAEESQVDRAVKEVRPVALHEALHLSVVGLEHL